MKNFLIVVLIIAIIGGTGYGVYYQIDNHNKKNEVSNVVNESNDNGSDVDESSQISQNNATVENNQNPEVTTIEPGVYKVVYKKTLDQPHPSGLESIDMTVTLTLNSDNTASIHSGDSMAVVEDSTGTYKIEENILTYTRLAGDYYGDNYVTFNINSNQLILDSNYFDGYNIPENYLILNKI